MCIKFTFIILRLNIRGKIIKYSESIINAYPLLIWIVCPTINLISEIYYYVKKENMHL